MSRVGKACLLAAGLFILAAGVVRLILNSWHDSLYIPLALAVLAFIAAIVKDIRFYGEFFTMRTTKHGMNMGALILLALVFLVSLNFVAVRYDKKFDLTKEKLNSLSDQSEKAVKAVNQEMKFVMLMQPQAEQSNVKGEAQQSIRLYSDANKNIKYEAYNARKRPDLAKKYDFTGGEYALFVDYKGKKVKVENLTEEEITRAIIKVTRDKKSVAYFLTGHGERDIEAKTPEAISDFKTQLSDLYDIKTLSLFDKTEVPGDAALVAIIGPKQQMTDAEMAVLRNYARKGGRLMVAADPNQRHNLSLLLKPLGVEFQNNLIIDSKVARFGGSPLNVLGTRFSQSNEATSRMASAQGITQHFEVSVLKKAPDAPKDFRFDDMVSTDENTGAASGSDLSPEVLIQALRTNRGPFTIAMSVQGKLTSPMETPTLAATPPGGEKPKDEKAPGAEGNQEFTLVALGDSDFLSNQLFAANLNRDLALNSVAYLTKDTDLISIRPKRPAGSTLTLTDNQGRLFLFGFLIPLPILLFFSGGFIWYRRRQA